jgi:hypothetical protein
MTNAILLVLQRWCRPLAARWLYRTGWPCMP